MSSPHLSCGIHFIETLRGGSRKVEDDTRIKCNLTRIVRWSKEVIRVEGASEFVVTKTEFQIRCLKKELWNRSCESVVSKADVN
jgi:hypothetical protein